MRVSWVRSNARDGKLAGQHNLNGGWGALGSLPGMQYPGMMGMGMMGLQGMGGMPGMSGAEYNTEYAPPLYYPAPGGGWINQNGGWVPAPPVPPGGMPGGNSLNMQTGNMSSFDEQYMAQVQMAQRAQYEQTYARAMSEAREFHPAAAYAPPVPHYVSNPPFTPSADEAKPTRDPGGGAAA